MHVQNDEGVVNNCFNLDCGGFHLVDKTPAALGAQFGNKDSQVGGDIYGIAVGIHRVIVRSHYFSFIIIIQ